MLAAILAHYDPDATWSASFLTLLDALREIAQDITVVTTAREIDDLPAGYESVNLIRRPNIGYDFYSYRVGLCSVLQRSVPDGVFIVNSSFVVVNRECFRDLLRSLSSNRKSVIRGVTSSNQISWHIQSYLLFLDTRAAAVKQIIQFLENVEPTNSKFETIVKYEIGLGRLLQEKGIPSEVWFSPSLRTRIQAVRSKYASLANESGEQKGLALAKKAWNEINWTHFGAAQLAQDCGVAKIEVVRDNPHCVDLQAILDRSDESGIGDLHSLIERTKRHYVRGDGSLSELRSGEGNSLRQMLSFPSRIKSTTKIAVVLHAFHIDLLEEALGYTENILEPYTLFVTTPFEADIPAIIRAASKRGLPFTIALTENNGFDVGPFISLYRHGALDEFDAVLKLHTKRSVYSKNGSYWRQQLYKQLCGDSLTVFRSLELLRSEGCGQVGPHLYFLSRTEFMGANRENLSAILRSCIPQSRDEEVKVAFFAGTMFWFSPSALASIKTCGSYLVKFGPSTGQQDGTLAHAWERAFSYLVWSAGQKVSTKALEGVDIRTINTDHNSVPVL